MTTRVILPALPTRDEDFWPYAVVDSEGHIHCPCCEGVDTMDEEKSGHELICTECYYLSDGLSIAEEY